MRTFRREIFGHTQNISVLYPKLFMVYVIAFSIYMRYLQTVLSFIPIRARVIISDAFLDASFDT